MGGDPQRDAAGGGAAAIPVDDAINWMFRPPVTQEQTDAWFQTATPSASPEPDSYGPGWQLGRALHSAGQYIPEGAKWLGHEVMQGILPDEDLARIRSDPTSIPSMAAIAGAALNVGTLLSGGEGVKLAGGEKIPAGGGFVWGAKPIDELQGLPQSGVMPETRFAKYGKEGGPFSQNELGFMKQLVPDAFTESGVDVPALHEGLAESGPIVEVKKLGGVESTPEGQRLAQVTHELDTRFPGWQDANPPMAQGPQQLRLIEEHNNLTNAVGRISGPQYGFLGPKPENQMPGYVEGLVRIPQDVKTGQGIIQNEPHGATEEPLFSGPHFGSEDTNVLSHYRGYEETLPGGEKAFHVVEVQSDWAEKMRPKKDDQGNWTVMGHQASDKETANLMYQRFMETQGHPLLENYESLGLKAAIQHAKEIGATKVILPDAETAMMTQKHDNPGNLQYNPVEGAQPIKVRGPSGYNFETKLPPQWRWEPDIGRTIATNPEGKPFTMFSVDPRIDYEPITTENIGYKSPGSGLNQAETWAVPIEPKIPQEGGMRLHYDQTIPSAMRKLTGDKGQPIDLGTHKAADSRVRPNWPTDVPHEIGSPVFKNPDGTPKTNITGKIYDISKTPDQFKLMKAGDKFSAARYLAS